MRFSLELLEYNEKTLFFAQFWPTIGRYDKIGRLRRYLPMRSQLLRPSILLLSFAIVAGFSACTEINDPYYGNHGYDRYPYDIGCSRRHEREEW